MYKQLQQHVSHQDRLRALWHDLAINHKISPKLHSVIQNTQPMTIKQGCLELILNEQAQHIGNQLAYSLRMIEAELLAILHAQKLGYIQKVKIDLVSSQHIQPSEPKPSPAKTLPTVDTDSLEQLAKTCSNDLQQPLQRLIETLKKS